MKILLSFSLLLICFSCNADPTQPAAGWGKHANALVQKNTAVDQSLKVQLIKKNGSGWLAIIDGNLVREGQSLANYKVLEINAKQVVIERNGNRQILNLHNTAIKQYE
ncbi:hypothetical protein [Rheinheimera sp. WS51]|uniref:hypothetical protein n=1 Tax=Rheinheimera sp. WS51 TaxID=3425886 RepID=UPI003D9287FA